MLSRRGGGDVPVKRFRSMFSSGALMLLGLLRGFRGVCGRGVSGRDVGHGACCGVRLDFAGRVFEYLGM